MADDSNDIERYRNNLMSDQERHAFEKRALTDPFLADALEGAERIDSGKFAEDVQSLSRKAIGSAKSSRHTPIRIAAGIFLVVTVGWLVYRDQVPTPKPLAQKANDSVTSPVPDSSSRLLTLAEPKDQQPTTTAEGPTAKSTTPAASKKSDVATEEKNLPSAVTTPIAEPATEELAAADGVNTKENAAENAKAAAPASRMQRAESKPSLRTITGKVIEAEDGVPLTGAVIRDMATQQVASTAADGSYTIQAAENTILQYSYNGLQTLETRPGNQSGLDVRLKDDASRRSEVIVFPPSGEESPTNQPLVLAAPVGGLSAYGAYLETNQQIPAAARAAQLTGKVTIGFTVAANGSLSDFEVLKGVGFGCEEEVIRLIRSGPPWSPALKDGKPQSATVWVKLEFVANR